MRVFTVPPLFSLPTIGCSFGTTPCVPEDGWVVRDWKLKRARLRGEARENIQKVSETNLRSGRIVVTPFARLSTQTRKRSYVRVAAARRITRARRAGWLPLPQGRGRRA